MRHGIGVAEDEMTAVVDAVVSGVNRAGWAAVDRRVAA
jgi:2-isopropylmalate synthase